MNININLIDRRDGGDLVQGRPGDQCGQFQGAEGSENISAAPAGGRRGHQHQVPTKLSRIVLFFTNRM